MEADNVAGIVECSARSHIDNVVTVSFNFIIIKARIDVTENLGLAIRSELNHVNAAVTVDTIIIDPNPFLHSTHRY